MNCKALQRWLDEGMPEATAAGMRDHAAKCAHCEKVMRVGLEVEALLEAPATRAPSGFTDRVMMRVTESNAATNAERRARWGPPAMAWWVEAAAHPATVLAMAVASLLVWQRGALLALAADLAAGKYSLPPLPWLETFQRLEIAAGVGIGLLPVAALIGWFCYHLTEHLASARIQARGTPLGVAS